MKARNGKPVAVSEVRPISAAWLNAPGRFCAPAAVAVQAIPVTAAAFFATRLSFEPVFRSALFAVFLTFDKDPDLLRFFMFLCLPVIAPPDGRMQIEKCPAMRSGAGWVIGCLTRLADLTPDPAREPRNDARASAASPPTQHQGTKFVS